MRPIGERDTVAKFRPKLQVFQGRVRLLPRFENLRTRADFLYALFPFLSLSLSLSLPPPPFYGFASRPSKPFAISDMRLRHLEPRYFSILNIPFYVAHFRLL